MGKISSSKRPGVKKGGESERRTGKEGESEKVYIREKERENVYYMIATM